MKNPFYGNQYVGNIRLYMRKSIQEASAMYRKCVTIVGIIAIAGYIFAGGVFSAKVTIEPETLWAKEIIEVPIKTIPPVMQRIAQCESNNQHTRNGQVIFNANTNKTVDIGKYQINSIWSKQATDLKLNLSIEADNEAFAMYLYENYGTEPWYSSAKCWNK